MKKAIMLMLITLVFAISGCKNELYKIEPRFLQEDEVVRDMVNEIVESARKQESNDIKELFSEKVINTDKDIDKQIKEFLNLFKNGIIKYYYDDCPTTGGRKKLDKNDYEMWIADADFNLLIYTSDTIYELSVKYIIIDDYHENNEGLKFIHAKKVKKVEESDGSFYAKEYYDNEEIKGNGIIIR